MNKDVHSLIRILSETIDFPEPIWEIGSYQVEGQEEIANMRKLFPAKQFIGIDMREGPGVDRIENIERIDAPNNSAGSILCLFTLEHVKNFYAGIKELHRVLKPGGVLIITTPFTFPIHEYPSDYWRFTPQALDYLTQDFPMKFIGYQGYKTHPHTTFAVAFKEEYNSKMPSKLQLIKDRMSHAITPRKIKFDRRVRFAIAKMLAGKKLFRERDYWHTFDIWAVHK